LAAVEAKSGQAAPAGAASPLLAAIDGLSALCGWLGAALVAAMLAIICYDVALRYLLNSPTSWSTEIATYMLVAMAFLAAAWAQREGAHIRVELLVERLRGEARRTLELLCAWLGLVLVAFLAWQAIVVAYDNWVNGVRIFSLLNTPVYLPQIPVAVGLAAFALAVLADIYRLSPPPSAWREWLGAALVPATALALWQLGLRPPRALGTVFDWGSVTLAGALLALCWLWSGWRAALLACLSLALGAAAFALSGKAGIGWVAAGQIVVTLAALCLGVRISLALGLVGLLGVYFLLPAPTPITLGERAWESVNTFTLTAVPMFVLMGALLLRSGLSDMVFDALTKWLGRFPGGLAHAGVGACGMFAAVSGSSLATAATLGIVACPEMIRRGYSPRLAYGSIAAGGTLGILIPPSIPMIIYGATTGAPIATLFIAGVVPGVLLVLAFMATIFVWAKLWRGAAPRIERAAWSERFASLLQILPILLMIAAVLGVLYAGVATPSEAGALGAAAALAVCLARRRLDLREFWQALLETAKVSSFLFMIVVGASILTYGFDYLRLPALLVDAVRQAQLEPWLVMLAIAVVYIVMGMFLDSISMMVMTLPVLFPLISSIGFDPIWFGVILVILLEIGLVTPPVGMNLFVLRGLSGATPLKEIAWGATPFALVMTLSLALFYVWPDLVTWLPGQMM
jgi:tripartite ATP-independent transporter DctM subunit